MFKLNLNGKITAFKDSFEDTNEAIKDIKDVNYISFEIISSTKIGKAGNLAWKKYPDDFFPDLLNNEKFHESLNLNTSDLETSENDPDEEEKLNCGKSVNFTYYDDLVGVANRNNFRNLPEPEIAYMFLKKKTSKALKNFDIVALEKRLKKAKREKPRSLQLYNQIGNFYRIKGDASQSIECFRKALAVSPSNAEVLLNLARVLFNHLYLDDAIHLTRRSLEVQPRDRSAWRQYYTLGEIFKAYGHYSESILHLRHALELHPTEKIKKALRECENGPVSSVHSYTVIIIICLVMGVLLVIVSQNLGDNSQNLEQEPTKIQRHFNRAMAMRSLKGFKCRK